MRAGVRLAWPLLALSLGALLAAGPALAAHEAEGAECARDGDAVSCHINIRPPETRSADVWVDEASAGRNFDSGDGSEHLLVRAGTAQRAWTLVRFPLQDIPRNITLRGAEVRLHAAEVDLTEQRTLRMYELRDPWDEATVTWAQAKDFNIGATAVANVSRALQVSPSDVGAAFHPFGGDDPETQGNDADRADEGVPQSFRKYYLGQEPYHGHVFKDEDSTRLNLPSAQKFNSSADGNALQHRPMLVVRYDPNTPDLRTLLADGQPSVNATSRRAVNLTFEVFDRLGDVTNAWVNATDEHGREVFNRSVFQNRTTVFINFDRHQVWSNQSLDLGEGRYAINALAVDTDGNINYTLHRSTNLTVENTPPYVNQTRLGGAPVPFLSATELNEGQTFQVNVNATDQASPQGFRSGIASVRLSIERGGEVLRNLSLNPRQVDANASGDYRLDVTADVAGFLNATVWVQDRAGNLNASGPMAMHVRDVLAPVIHEARVLAPGRTAEGAIQEEGGVVAWEARVVDASPLTVTLLLSGPGGDEELPMARQGLTDRYRFERAFTLGGSYGAAIVARDLDGNTAQATQLGFFLLEPKPPEIGELRPTPDSFGPGEAVVSALVSDLNLDPSSIVLETRVEPAPFVAAEASTVTVTETSRRVEVRDRFFHGERVEVRVRASDLLGRSAERAWSFVVDDRTPATFLTTEGPALAGERTAVTGNTTLRLERTDQGSGLLATVIAIVNEDRGLGTGNVTLTGSAPATLRLSASPVYTGTGNYTLFYGSVDLAGNAEPTQRRRLLVDDTAPRVQVAFEPGLLTATVDERGTGIREARAFYWLAPGGQQGSTLMSPNADRTVWQAQIPDAERGARVLYAVEATDQLGNLGRAGSAANPLSSIVQNHRPTVSISPGNGSLVRGTVTIEWAASDKDGDNLETSLSVRPSTSTDARSLVPRRLASGSFAWDTRGIGDGVWVVEVSANDGFEPVTARSFVEVTNTDSKIVAFQVSAGEPGQAVRFEATLYKPVQRAEAVVRLGDREVARVPLRDDGGPPDRREHDGVFTGQFLPDRAADYRVDLDVVFEDGRLETRDRAAVAQVQYAFPARIVHEPLLLLLVIGVPVALAGFFLYRRYGAPRFLRKWLR